MTLERKVLILHAAVAAFILVCVGGLLYLASRFDRLEELQQESANQLRHIDFALTSFITEADRDVMALAANEVVRTRQDEDFTSYLDADPGTFVQHIGTTEQKIVDLFSTFRRTHPHVNSVYMGRENGSFVRSHPRAEATQYDPRTRPWYILGRDYPGEVIHTEPYPSLTTSDVNIGVVTALVDTDGSVYGVVGADITLVRLTEYLSGFEVGHQGQIVLVDQTGTILASREDALLFQNVSVLVGEEASRQLLGAQGMITFGAPPGANRLFFYSSPQLGWKIGIIVPEQEIALEIWRNVLPVLTGLALALVLVSGLTFIGLRAFVIRPLTQLNFAATEIARTGDLTKSVNITSADEIGSLSASFNQMMVSMDQVQQALRKERDLAEALKDAAATLSTTLDFETVLDRMLEQVSRVVPNEACNFMLVEGTEVRAARWLGYERFGAEEYISRIRFPLSETPTFGRMASQKEPLLLGDVAEFPDWRPVAEMEWLRSFAATPMIVRERVIGFLCVDSSVPNFFGERDLEVLHTFAGHAAAAIENARLYEQVKRDALELEGRIAAATLEIRQQAEQLAVLNELGRALTTHLSVQEVLEETYRGAARLLDAANFYITLCDEVRGDVTCVLRVVDGKVENPVPVPQGGLTDYLMRTREPLLMPDGVEERTAELGIRRFPYVADRTATSWVGVPMVLGDRVLGTMVALKYSPGNGFTDGDRDLLWALANQAAIAINNAQLYANSEQHALELGVLYEVSRDITATPALGPMLQTIVDSVVRLVGADKSLLVLMDIEKRRLLEIVGDGYDPSRLEAHTFDELDMGLTGWVLREKQATLSEDLRTDPRNRDVALASAKKSNDRSAAIAPLLIGGQPIGTLTAVNGAAKPTFTSVDLNLVTMLAGQAAVAIQKARLYEAAQEADRLKSAFLASMSHELRTPLNSIIGFTGILLQGLVGPLNDEQKKQLGMVMSSARHLLDLINDVLDISKIEAGELALASEPFDMRESIERVSNSITPLADKKGLRLITTIGPGVATIVGDRRRVEQVLVNLANNAVKFTEAGEVRIECELVNKNVVTRVTDTGIGIRSEDIEKLFKPFRQIDSGTARQHEGTGLGLSICEHLVSMMGGRIWVESEFGAGSTFSFELPTGELHGSQDSRH